MVGWGRGEGGEELKGHVMIELKTTIMDWRNHHLVVNKNSNLLLQSRRMQIEDVLKRFCCHWNIFFFSDEFSVSDT